MTEQNADHRNAVESVGATNKRSGASEIEGPTAVSEVAVESSDGEQNDGDNGSHCHQNPLAQELFSLPFSALVLIATFTIGAVGAGALMTMHQISQHSDHVVVRVLIEDKVLELNDGQVSEFNAAVEGAIIEQHEAVYEDLASEVDGELDALFERPLANISEFVDWYYSMTGSMLRLIALRQDGGAEFVSNQFADQVLDDGELERNIRLMDSGAQHLLEDLEDDVARYVNQVVLARFDARPAESANASLDAAPEVHVNDAVRDAMRFSNTQDFERWRLSAYTGTSAAAMYGSGVIAASVISWSPRISAALARTGQSIARLAGQRIGAAAARGATTAALTAWTGPAAPIIGTTVTVTTFFGTEYASLAYQRGTEGREMEDNLRMGLVEVRDQIKMEITKEYRQRIDRRVALLEERLVDQSVRLDDKDDFYVFGSRVN